MGFKGCTKKEGASLNRHSVKDFLLEFRILQVGITIYLCYVLHWIVDWMTQVPYSELSEWQLATTVAAVPAIITGLFASLKSAVKPEQ